MVQKLHGGIENAGMQTLKEEKHTFREKGRDGGKIEIQGRRKELMNSLREESEVKGRNGGRQRKLPELKLKLKLTQ